MGRRPCRRCPRYHRPVPQTVPVAPPATPHLLTTAASRRVRPHAPAAAGARRAPRVPPPVLVEVHRGAIVESRHRGHVVQVDADGRRHPGRRHAGRGRHAALDGQAVRARGAHRIGRRRRSGSDPAGAGRHVRLAHRRGQARAHAPGASSAAPASASRCCAAARRARRRTRVTAARLARDGETAGPHPPPVLGLPRREPPAHPPTPTGRWPTTRTRRTRSQVAVRETVARLFGRRPASLRTSPDNCGVLTYEFPLVDVARAYVLLADPDGAAAAMPARARSAPALRAHPRRDDGRAGHGRRHLREPGHRAHAPPPGPLVSKGGADGLRAIGLLPAVRRRRRASGGPGHQDRGRRPLARAIKAVTRGGAGPAIACLDDRDLRALAAFRSPHAPGRRRVRRPPSAAPVFELAPLGELA